MKDSDRGNPFESDLGSREGHYSQNVRMRSVVWHEIFLMLSEGKTKFRAKELKERLREKFEGFEGWSVPSDNTVRRTELSLVGLGWLDHPGRGARYFYIGPRAIEAFYANRDITELELLESTVSELPADLRDEWKSEGVESDPDTEE